MKRKPLVKEPAYMFQPLRLSHLFATGLLVYGIGALAASAWAQSASPLAPYRNRNRVVVIFAPSLSDARLGKQIALFNGRQAEEADRDIVRVLVFEGWQKTMPRGVVSEAAARALRRKYQVRPGQFRVLLVGKDGNVAYGQSTPVTAEDLFERIDRMPMRRAEMRRRGQL